MIIKNVMVEIRMKPELEASLFAAGITGADAISAANAAVTSVPGLTLDLSFPPVPVPSMLSVAAKASLDAASAEMDQPDGRIAAPTEPELMVPDFDGDTIILRGTMDESAFDANMFVAGPQDGVQAVYADPVIEQFITCGSSSPVGTAADVGRLLDTPSLRRAGMDGRGVLLAIVDTGINLGHLRALGLVPQFSEERSWTPPLQPGQPPMRPGQMPVGHGTMCAFDGMIAAPRATLVDIAVLASRRPSGSAMDGLLSDAVLGYSHLMRLMRGLGRPGDFHSLVVSNSWGMFQASWDFPPGHPGNYSDNPAHPFNRIVATLERTGADILFAAGNCGRECPDGRCGTQRDAGIYGANSHPAVISVAGVDVRKQRVGYSTRGPGRLDRQKPDVAGYTHFVGSRVYPADGGTSAATPVVAGLVAAFRSRFPTGPGRTPSMLRNLVRQTAENVGTPGFDIETGFGIASGTRLARSTLLTVGGDNTQDAIRDSGVLPEEDRGVDDLVNDQEFMEALSAFELQAASGIGATARSCESCGEQQSLSGVKELTMNSSNDQEFMQALQAFGGGGSFGMGASGGESGAFGGGGSGEGFGGSGSGEEFGGSDSGMEGGSDQEFMQALQAFGGGMTGGLGTATAGGYGGGMGMGMGDFGGGADVTAAPSLATVCRTWRSVRPIVLRILPFLAALPGIGAPVAAAFRTLGTLLDAVCRGGGGGAAALCQRWRQGLRTIVVRVASVVGRIPFFGSAAARALRALISAIDTICRGS
jgi:subtilisin family serine protease